MINEAHLHLRRSFKAFSRFAGCAVLSVGGLVLVGWIFDIPALKGVLPGFVTMKFNTALCFALTGIALLLQEKSEQGIERRISQICAVGAALVGLLSLLEYLLGWDLGIDQWLIHEPATAFQALYPGRMAPSTSINFLLLGSGLWWLKHPHGYRIAQGLTLVATVLSLLAVVGYLYGEELLYRLSVYTSVAPTTAGTLLVLSVGVLLVVPDRGLLAVITTRSAGGVMARRLLPVSIFLPVVLGWLALQGINAGIYDAAFSASVTALSSVAILTAVILVNANSVHRIDDALRQSRHDLEVRVQERTVTLSATNTKLEGEVLHRQQAEKEVAEERNLLRTLIDNLPDYIFAKDLEGRFVISNLAHTRAAHLASAEELVGKTALEVFPSEFAAQFHADDLTVMASIRMTHTPCSFQRLFHWRESVLTRLFLLCPLDKFGRCFRV